jgi:phage repressor protein C with HTH and peptisase S24 domain
VVTAKAARSFLDRLKIAAARAGGIDELAQAAGIARRTFGNYLSGRNEPKRPQLLAIAQAARVSVAWLAGGDEPMTGSDEAADFRHDRPGLHEAAAASFAAAPALASRGFVVLPRYDLRAASGGDAVIRSEQIVDVLAFRADWIKHSLRLDPDNLALISAVGDAMKPTIEEGDLLLLDLTTGQLRDNAIYVVGVGGALLVKRIQRLTSGGIRVVSDNPAYPPEEIPARDAGALRFVGRVVWRGVAV